MVLFAPNQSNTTTSIQQLDDDMEQLLSSNKPDDIVLHLHIWEIPLVIMEKTADYSTNPIAPPGLGVGPWNTMISGRELANTSFKIPGFAPNADTLYDLGWLDLKLR